MYHHTPEMVAPLQKTVLIAPERALTLKRGG